MRDAARALVIVLGLLLVLAEVQQLDDADIPTDSAPAARDNRTNF